MKKALTLVAFLAACGGKQASGPYISGFNPPDAAPGYTRFVSPVIQGIKPGTDAMWCQFVAVGADKDIDVVDITGVQSKYGHHIVMYASKTQAPVGTSRLCTESDMLSVRFLGGIGGEGGGTVKPPPGYVLRLGKGETLMMNTHFLNAGRDTIDGQGVVDVKFLPPSAANKPVVMFVNLNDEFTVAANADTSADATCVAEQDMSFLMFGNHMHGLGRTVKTEILHAGGSTELAREDLAWTFEMQFNPKFDQFTAAQPLQVKKGDTIKTHCEWRNGTANEVSFPTEMCVGLGFFIEGGPEIHCANGQWSN
jgi:hypothetical protein